MKYRIFIGPINNSLSSEDFFIGTGFTGVPIETREDFVQAIKKYARNKDGIYKAKIIKLAFCLDETMSLFKKEGDKQVKENGFVELFSLACSIKKDPFHGKTIYYCPQGWIDDNKKVFHVLYREQENSNVVPFYGRVSDCMVSLGIKIKI